MSAPCGGPDRGFRHDEEARRARQRTGNMLRALSWFALLAGVHWLHPTAVAAQARRVDSRPYLVDAPRAPGPDDFDHGLDAQTWHTHVLPRSVDVHHRT